MYIFRMNSREKGPNNFQRELQSKMRDRRSRGLATDVTPSPSFHDSGDELDSDDGMCLI